MITEATKTRGIEEKTEVSLGCDNRFRDLLTDEEWFGLQPAVRRRFSKRISEGATTVYVGTITEMRRNRMGAALTHALRLIGAPLPIGDDVDVPSVVSVTEDVATGGQIWTRLYANKSCFPQVIHSSKRFSGPTGLEEYIGFGISMALTVHNDDGALVFESAGYAINLDAFRIPIPKWLQPGQLTVRHADEGGREFEFSMALNHPVFGELVHQIGHYREERQ